MEEPTTAGLYTSNSNPSLRPISNRTESTKSAVSQVGVYRHALLKSNVSRQQPLDKDLPIPPVLTHSPPTSRYEDPAQDSNPHKPLILFNQFSEPEIVSPSRDHTLMESPEHTIISLGSATYPRGQPSPRDDGHLYTWRLPISKVRPAVENINEYWGFNSQSEYSPASPVSPGKMYPMEDHFHHSRMRTPKVRPFMDYSSAQASELHEGHDQATKAEETTTLHSPSQPQIENTKESPKVATYWGILPRFTEKQSKRSREVYQLEDASPMLNSRVGSPHLSQTGSQKSSIDVQLTNLESTSLQENLRHENEMLSKSSAKSSNGRCAERSTPSISSPRLQDPASESINQAQQSSQPKRLDARRTSAWLRKILGHTEPNSPTLTKLPEKAPPRRESREEGLSDEIGSFTSRVTTFSGKNAADMKAMNNAVHNLEQLLNEALYLANEASEQEHCGHLDDANLPLQSIYEGSTRTIHTPSVHESIRHGSSEDGGTMSITNPQNVSTGVVKDVNHGCETLFLRHDGHILRPLFPSRVRHHNPDDSCVLPMPPPDCQLKRQCLSPQSYGYSEDDPTGIIRLRSGEVPNSREVREYIRVFHQPPVCTRNSSRNPHKVEEPICEDPEACQANRLSEIRQLDISFCSLDGGTSDDIVDFSIQHNTGEKRETGPPNFEEIPLRDKRDTAAKYSEKLRKKRTASSKHAHELRNVSLRNKSHVSIKEGQRFSLTKSAKRQPTIARDWAPARKRFVATVACISTALVGVLIGIYAGLVPSIQYYIADFHHYSILGNVGLYLGMALPTFFCWPLPLLHGRKPYIVGSLCIAMPLLFPQAIAISARRSPDTSVWRWALLSSRALMGFFLGLANMNFHSMLTDLFGASLMSSNPHQEVVDEYDCFIGSLSAGFVIGAVVIDSLQPSWGLYISIVIIAVVLLLNVLCPEVRRSAWRRSVAEVRMGASISRRLARGEIMMHRVQTGPRWWGQEVYHGAALSLEMLRQPGFTILAVYSAWVYAQIVLIIVLLGSLTSKSYRFRSPYVGAVVSSVAIGALAAIPFQKANLFSRARNTNPLSNRMTFDKKIVWSSHLVRRAIFTLILPVAGILYTVVSAGPPIHIFFPSFFAALVGFLSCLAISECNGLLIETWDCSDLQPGMTGRSKSTKDSHKRTNYSSFPRVTAGWNFSQSLGFILAAGATGLGGSATRRLGQRAATGVVAGISFILTILLLCSLARFTKVQIIPDCSCSEMDRWTKERRDSFHNWAAAVAAAKASGSKNINKILEDDVG
ncbi:hypothetical protein F5Y19DRAFT_484433 [Xylariaceae sp. FL1651]|nr:hypothetical protein F5Y19DRAFT_484433 [Xylariaceae sp. FL1651]